MKVKLILPALTEARSPLFRPIKYSLFPPLGLATLAGFLDDEDEANLQDEHVEALDLDDEPDLVVIQVYITSAYRAYRIADHYRRKGAYVVLGGLHVTSLPDEAAAHADTIFLGPGEDTWPRFLADFRRGAPEPLYRSQTRTLAGIPPIRRDLIKRHLYLVPNSIVVSRGCPHVCDFCYKEAFFEGGKSFYTQTVDAALAEIDRVSAGADVARAARTGLLARLPRVLPVGCDRPRRRRARRAALGSAALRLRRRLEEVRAAVGRDHPRQARGDDAAGAGGDSQ